MPEPVTDWWARRQRSKGVDDPYPVGTYRPDWERYPMLIRQYFPDQNHGIMLTQIPPAAEVYLLWTCEVGHRFVATPEEQRNRPGRERRRSTWCPECAWLAAQQPVRRPRAEASGTYDCGHTRDDRAIDDGLRCALCRRLDGSAFSRERLLALVSPGQRASLSLESKPGRRYRWVCAAGHGTFEASTEKIITGRRCIVCSNADAAAASYTVGDSFVSPWAPKPASAAEALVRQRLAERLDVDLSHNAVRVQRPFFNHVEVWPDIVIPELRVALEYDTVGRHGLEHVGRRESVDKRKDRALRHAGWEVIRIRVGKLRPLGPFDVVTGSLNATLVDRIEEQLATIRGDLMVRAYRR